MQATLRQNPGRSVKPSPKYPIEGSSSSTRSYPIRRSSSSSSSGSSSSGSRNSNSGSSSRNRNRGQKRKAPLPAINEEEEEEEEEDDHQEEEATSLLPEDAIVDTVLGLTVRFTPTAFTPSTLQNLTQSARRWSLNDLESSVDLVNNLRGVFDYVIEEKRNATPSAATSAAATASAVPRSDEGSSAAVASGNATASSATSSAATSAAATASAVPRADEGSSTAVASASLRLLIDAAVNSEVAVEMISETPNKSHK